MNRAFYRLKTFLRFSFLAGNKYSIHSPFLYQFYTYLQENKNIVASEVKKIRKLIKKHYCFYVAVTKNSNLASTIKKISINKKEAILLSLITKKVNPCLILELGTGFGTSAVFLAKFAPLAKIITVDIDDSRINFAKSLFNYMAINNVHIKNCLFEDYLNEIHNSNFLFDLIFIDGDHRGCQLIKYVDLMLKLVHENLVVVIHDIYWSNDMTKAWEKLIQLPQVTLSVDFFNFGLLFFNSKIFKQHHRLKFP